MTIKIRPALETDIPAIAAIYGNHVANGQASFEYDPPSNDEMLRRYHSITENGCPYLVACDGETVIGYAYAGLFHARKAYEKSVENSIYISPEAQGKGLGKKLLTRLIEECQQCEFRQMIAVITKLDPPVSIALHERLGFRHVGVLKEVGFKHGDWLDVVYMQKAL